MENPSCTFSVCLQGLLVVCQWTFAFVRMLSCVWNACRYTNKPTGRYVRAGNTGSGSYSSVVDRPKEYWHPLCFALFVTMHLWGEHDWCKHSSWPKIGNWAFVSSAYWFYFSCAIFSGHYSEDKYSPCFHTNKEDMCLYTCAFLSRKPMKGPIRAQWSSPLTNHWESHYVEQYLIPNDSAFHA